MIRGVFNLRRALITIVFALVAGCSPHRVTENPKPPSSLPAQYAEKPADNAKQLPEQWWKSFGDSRLNALVARALGGNFQLRGAWARLKQANAVLAQTNSGKWPQLNLDASAGRSSQRLEFQGTEFTDTNNQFRASAGAAYEVDLWRRLGSQSSAAKLDQMAIRDDVEAIATSVAAEISETWFDMTSQQAQLKLLTAQIETNERLLELVKLRFRHGLVSALDVYQQRQQLVATRAQLALANSALGALGHRLTVLVGYAQSGAEVRPSEALPELPPLPGVGVPADLLERRPDVRAARRRVEAADYRVAAAVADRLPGLRLSGSTSLQDSKLSQLIAKPLWSILAAVTAPLIDGGRRRAEVRRNKAIVEEQVANYGQVMLQAMTEVESALVQERGQLSYVSELTKQVEIAKASLREAQSRYRAGLSDYLRVLSSLQALQQTEIALLQAQRQMFSFRVQLCRALGGSWTRKLSPKGVIDPSGVKK